MCLYRAKHDWVSFFSTGNVGSGKSQTSKKQTFFFLRNLPPYSFTVRQGTIEDVQNVGVYLSKTAWTLDCEQIRGDQLEPAWKGISFWFTFGFLLWFFCSIFCRYLLFRVSVHDYAWKSGGGIVLYYMYYTHCYCTVPGTWLLELVDIQHESILAVFLFIVFVSFAGFSLSFNLLRLQTCVFCVCSTQYDGMALRCLICFRALRDDVLFSCCSLCSQSLYVYLGQRIGTDSWVRWMSMSRRTD